MSSGENGIHSVQQAESAPLNGEFILPFNVVDDDGLEVWVNGARLPAQSYVVDAAVRRVTVTPPPPAGALVTFVRRTGLRRATAFADGMILRAAALNDEFDRIYAILEELEARLERCLRHPPWTPPVACLRATAEESDASGGDGGGS